MLDTKKLLANGISRNIPTKFKFHKDLAAALAIDKVTLSGYTSGNSFPRPSTIDSIASLLDVTPATLFCTADEQEALELGLRIHANPLLAHVVQLCESLSPDDLALIIRFAELAAGQSLN